MEVDEEKFNISMRKFLKTVGITSQQKIEASIRNAQTNNMILGDSIAISVNVQIKELDLNHSISGKIILKDT